MFHVEHLPNGRGEVRFPRNGAGYKKLPIGVMVIPCVMFNVPRGTFLNRAGEFYGKCSMWNIVYEIGRVGHPAFAAACAAGDLKSGRCAPCFKSRAAKYMRFWAVV